MNQVYILIGFLTSCSEPDRKNAFVIKASFTPEPVQNALREIMTSKGRSYIKMHGYLQEHKTRTRYVVSNGTQYAEFKIVRKKIEE